MICCIDSMTFIWGIKKQSDEEMIARTLHLFKWMDENKHILLIPTIVIAEVLAPEPLEKHPVYLDRLSKGTIIADFDMMAATVYANLFRNKIEESKKVAEGLGIDNQRMKVDHLIIASAIAQRANCIYSHDNGVRAFGQKYIDVKELPHLPSVQQDLFSQQNVNQNEKRFKNSEENDETPF